MDDCSKKSLGFGALYSAKAENPKPDVELDSDANENIRRKQTLRPSHRSDAGREPDAAMCVQNVDVQCVCNSH